MKGLFLTVFRIYRLTKVAFHPKIIENFAMFFMKKKIENQELHSSNDPVLKFDATLHSSL